MSIRKRIAEFLYPQPKGELVSLGWVNLYLKENGQHHMSSLPKRSKQASINRMCPDPISEYIDTVEVFIRKKA